MSRRTALESLARVVVVAVLFSGGACVPGAIAPRRGAAGGDAGGATGGEVAAMRDGAIATDGVASELRFVGPGSGGGAGRMTDAGVPETPKLPSPDAARASPGDAADAPGGDAASRPDARSDAPPARTPRIGELVIDEVLVNPAGDDLGREWIELANLSAEWLDLSGLHLANASVDVAVAGGSIAPGGLRVLGQSADPSKNGGAPVDAAYGTKLILNNADGRVSICVGPCASGLALDTVSWGTLGDAYTGHALVVDPATQAICAAVAPFGTGASFGTPGEPNPPCGQNVDAASTPALSVAD